MYWSGRQTRTTNRKMVHMEESRQGTWFGTVYFFLDKSRQSLQGKNTKADLRTLNGYTKMLNCECQPGKMVSNVRETVVNIEIDYKVGPFI